MFVRFREKTAERYGGGEKDRECAGQCKDRPRTYPRYGIGLVVKGRSFLKGCPMQPLCPLKQKRCRLEVSIVESVRIDGKPRHRHVASLGSMIGDGIAAREIFWRECEARLARLGNRLGGEVERLRQAIAVRVPVVTDAERAAMNAAAWDQLEGMWDDHAKSRARRAVDEIKFAQREAKQHMRESIESEAITRQAKRLRGNAKAYDALNMLLGMTLSPVQSRIDHEYKAQLKAQIDEQDRR